MFVVELYLPTCVQIDLNALEDLKRSETIDFYEIKNLNSLIVFYFRGLKNYEKKEFKIGFAR